MRLSRAFVLLGLLALAGVSRGAVTLESLLKEMTDQTAIARFPDPAFTVVQASSYDRATKDPKDAKGWFANGDANKFIRAEDRDGRREWVMMDAQGPGAVVRFWSTSGTFGGTVRIYLDGTDKPTVESNIYELLSGKVAWAPKPLAIENVGNKNHPGGINLYLPLPYAKQCKITYEEKNPKDAKGIPPAPRYYNIEYRTYTAGTEVRSLSLEQLDAAKDLIQQTAKALGQPPEEFQQTATGTAGGELSPGGEATVQLAGPGAVRLIEVGVMAGEESQLAEALRTTILRIQFDGAENETVWCPVGDFFASGVGLNAVQSWYRTVSRDGKMVSRWVMPYRQSARISLLNLGRQPVRVSLRPAAGEWKWDDRSMHFHARWRSQHAIPTRPMTDWNYVTVDGKGVYLGDALAVFNPVAAWWGEGDEKIYVDGAAAPTHIGTGTEDYYCYAWCDPKLFQGPLCNQVRMDGPGNRGHTSVTRTRILDAIPFQTKFQMDMEVWHWADCKVDYAATSYYYAIPGAKDNRPPQPDEAKLPISEIKVQKIAGAIECETLQIVSKSDGLPTEVQSGMALADGAWSGDSQLWVRGRKVGDFVELKIPVKTDGPGAPVKLTLYATKSWDYGVLRFTVNGQVAGKDWDSWSVDVRASGPIELGTFTPKDGALILRAEVVGANEKSKNSKSFFGLDAVVIGKP